MKKLVIALLLLALPVAAMAVDATVGQQKYFNIGNKRAVTATLTVSGAQSTGYTLAARSVGLNNVEYYSLQVHDDSDVALYFPTWDIDDSLLKVYIANAGDSTSTLIGTPSTSVVLKIFAIGN